MTANEFPVCPRCDGYIPNNVTPGEYIGALSRTDNKTEICSDCGTEEAMEQFVHRDALIPKDMWPIQSVRRNKRRRVNL
jgi:hypothetical protein